MDDRFLTESRRDPEPGFARSLRATLRSLEPDARERSAPRWRPVFALGVALAVAVALFTLPAVRATAQQMLDLFRVHDFAVVQVDAARMEELKQQKFDAKTLLGGSVETLQESGPAQRFASIEAGTASAGFTPMRPLTVPRSMHLDSVFVAGESRERVTVDTRPLRELMDTFDVRDLTVPSGLDGQQVGIHLPRVMVQKYVNEHGSHAALIQASSPEVSLPAGVDLARLGEIGLRLMGLKPAEAHRMAQTIDWRSTLLVPVASTATTFQQITINGARGVYFDTEQSRSGDDDDKAGSVVLWSRDERIFALVGNIGRASLVTMAESVR